MLAFALESEFNDHLNDHDHELTDWRITLVVQNAVFWRICYKIGDYDLHPCRLQNLFTLLMTMKKLYWICQELTDEMKFYWTSLEKQCLKLNDELLVTSSGSDRTMCLVAIQRTILVWGQLCVYNLASFNGEKIHSAETQKDETGTDSRSDCTFCAVWSESIPSSNIPVLARGA